MDERDTHTHTHTRTQTHAGEVIGVRKAERRRCEVKDVWTVRRSRMGRREDGGAGGHAGVWRACLGLQVSWKSFSSVRLLCSAMCI